MKSSSAQKSQTVFIQNAKKTQVMVDEIKLFYKDILKKTKKWTQHIALAAHAGIGVSESMKNCATRFENNDMGNIQKVCTAMTQCGELVNNFVKVLDHLQINLDKNVNEVMRCFIEGELAMTTSSISPSNPKYSQALANTQLALDKFEIETLGVFLNTFGLFDEVKNEMEKVTNIKSEIDVTRSQQQQLQKAFEENTKADSSKYRNYFGIPLKKLIDDENRKNTQIPFGLEKALKYLYTSGIDSEGLFRVSSTPDKINHAQIRFLAINYSNEDPYLVANLVKTFLKEIPGKLIPKEAIPMFFLWDDALDAKGDDEKVQKKICEDMRMKLETSLSPEHFTCLNYIITFMASLSRSEKSKMTAESIATCVSPSIFYCDEKLEGKPLLEHNTKTNHILTFMIKNFTQIFTIPRRCCVRRKQSVYLQNPEEFVTPINGSPCPTPILFDRTPTPSLVTNDMSKHKSLSNFSNDTLV
ncbi:hypothetical protein EIN_372160 [Entamoeba invadens IP1]|uniref:Rho-GAP domain-containing protein n=1 Tax=Entamoeba invadens IP1 TaxID=370355 RepID=A0A0A1UFN4_ENTIV|nr:hypothetical protein EIN_372160 [Entamoeba invadens IP1]ELP92794.1 hypothetical protein EIN_372160 [Entamoeba invadens IP1]|eukprot:XP_004259565.1 hypothetical protein EIN_372160 [Entamoeba invadens IP1]